MSENKQAHIWSFELDIYSTGILLLTARSHSALSAQDFLRGRSKRGHPYSKQRLSHKNEHSPASDNIVIVLVIFPNALVTRYFIRMSRGSAEQMIKTNRDSLFIHFQIQVVKSFTKNAPVLRCKQTYEMAFCISKLKGSEINICTLIMSQTTVLQCNHFLLTLQYFFFPNKICSFIFLNIFFISSEWYGIW